MLDNFDEQAVNVDATIDDKNFGNILNSFVNLDLSVEISGEQLAQLNLALKKNKDRFIKSLQYSHTFKEYVFKILRDPNLHGYFRNILSENAITICDLISLTSDIEYAAALIKNVDRLLLIAPEEELQVYKLTRNTENNNIATETLEESEFLDWKWLTAENAMEKVFILLRYRKLIIFEDWVTKLREQSDFINEIWTDRKAKAALLDNLDEDFASSVLNIPFDRDFSISLLLDEEFVFNVNPIILSRIIARYTDVRKIMEGAVKIPLLRRIILFCVKSVEALAILRDRCNLIELFGGANDSELINLLFFQKEYSLIFDRERQKILNLYLANDLDKVVQWLALEDFVSDSINKADIIKAIIEASSEKKVVTSYLYKNKLFRQRILVDTLTNEPEAAAYILGSWLQEFLQEKEIIRALDIHKESRDFIHELKLNLLVTNDRMVQFLRQYAPKIYNIKLYEAALARKSVAIAALHKDVEIENQSNLNNNSIELAEEARLSSKQITSLLLWHGSKEFFESLGKKALNHCVCRAIQDIDRDIFNLLIHNPLLFSYLNATTIEAVNIKYGQMNLYKVKPIKSENLVLERTFYAYRDNNLTYLKLRQIVAIWRGWKNRLTSFSANTSRLFKPDGMPQIMREIVDFIRAIPENVNPDSEISKVHRITLEIIISDCIKRGSAETKNPDSFQSKLIEALKSTTTLQPLKVVNIEALINEEKIVEGLEKIKLSLQELKHRLEERHYNQSMEVINTFLYILRNPDHIKQSVGIRLNLSQGYCVVHMENYSSYGQAKEYLVQLAMQFLQVFNTYQKKKDQMEALKEFFSNFSGVCLEARCRWLADKIEQQTDEPIFSQLMQEYYEKGVAYLRSFGKIENLENVQNFILERHQGVRFKYDEKDANFYSKDKLFICQENVCNYLKNIIFLEELGVNND